MGEAVAGVVRGIASVPELTVRVALTRVFGIALSFGLWWIYFDFIGRRFDKDNFAWKARYGYLHLPLLISIAAVGEGVQSVVAQAQTDGLNSGERWLISTAVGLSLAAIGLIEHSLPLDKEEPVNQYLSANLKIALGIITPLLVGWTQMGTYILLGILLAIVMIPIIYGATSWFQAPISQRENERTSNNSGVAEADFK